MAAGATGALVNIASVSVAEGVADPTPGNDSDQDSDVVLTVGACGEFEDRALSDQTVSTTETFEACHSITASSGFEVVPPGDVTFRAGNRIVLEDEFSVGVSAVFAAILETP